jgi:hypothetical protein
MDEKTVNGGVRRNIPSVILNESPELRPAREKK